MSIVHIWPQGHNNEPYEAQQINRNTQRGREFLQNYENARYTSVNDYYGRPSSLKVDAENEILAEMQEVGGVDYRITGGNSCLFTCAYRLPCLGLVYHTRSHRYFISN